MGSLRQHGKLMLNSEYTRHRWTWSDILYLETWPQPMVSRPSVLACWSLCWRGRICKNGAHPENPWTAESATFWGLKIRYPKIQGGYPILFGFVGAQRDLRLPTAASARAERPWCSWDVDGVKHICHICHGERESLIHKVFKLIWI